MSEIITAGAPLGNHNAERDHVATNPGYAAAYDAFKKASTAHSDVVTKYRARTVGDKEFLASKAAFKKAQEDFDRAEQETLNTREPAKGNYSMNVVEEQEVTAATIVQCRASGVPLNPPKKWSFQEPTEFQWMPGGVSKITAGFGGRSIELNIECDPSTAKTVAASFERHVKASPRRKPFGCIEHHEEEKAFEPVSFAWKTDPEPGVFCTALPTKLGEENVNGRLHTSFSPSFGTDADYAHAKCRDCGHDVQGEANCNCNGTMYFPEGIRGSSSNPARVTGVSHKSVGSLTNWNAFKDILPVTAKEPDATIKAAGTSEGVKKSWETRKHGLSVDAHKATMNAHTATEAGERSKAIDAHHLASVSHYDAKEVHDAGSKMRDSHDDMSNFHKNMAKALESGMKVAPIGRSELHSFLSSVDASEPNKARSTDEVPSSVDLDTIYARATRADEIAAKHLGTEDEPTLAGVYARVNVTATGTSEGAEKGWQNREGRMHSLEDVSAKKAERAGFLGDKARKSGELDHHTAALKAFRDLHDAHLATAEASHNAGYSGRGRKYENDAEGAKTMMNYHAKAIHEKKK